MLSLSYTFSDAEDRLNHWEIPEDSSNPELDHADSASNTPHNFVASATWNIPGTGRGAGGMARERGRARAERQSLQHPLRAGSDRHDAGVLHGPADLQRDDARRAEHGARRRVRLRGPHPDADIYAAAAATASKFRADVFNLFNNENFAADGYIGIIGNVNYGKPTSGAYPGRQFQFGAIYRF